MDQNKRKIEFDEFIVNPTNLSKYIINLAEKSHEKYSPLISSGKLKDKIKLRLLYLNEYQNIFNFTESFEKNKLPNEIDLLFVELEKIFDYIAINNIFLAYAFVGEKNKINPIITKEDEKMLYLKKLYKNEILLKEFNEMFGHYALNAFEISSRRFSEYSKSELIKISKFLKNYQLNKDISIKEYLKNKKKNKFAVYSTLREELRYIALIVVSKLRLKFVELAKEKKIKNIFDMKYNDIKRKFYC
jgi:hypothetical protein